MKAESTVPIVLVGILIVEIFCIAYFVRPRTYKVETTVQHKEYIERYNDYRVYCMDENGNEIRIDNLPLYIESAPGDKVIIKYNLESGYIKKWRLVK